MRKRNGNRSRKILAVLLLAVLLIGMVQEAVPAYVKAAKVALPVSGTDWTLDEDGNLTIHSDAGMADWVANEETYKDMRDEQVKTVEIKEGVHSIGEQAFYFCRTLTEVSIPESVERIGARAFNHCERITEITVPSGVKEIENSVFFACRGLERVTLPDGLESIGGHAFNSCGLTEITIPSGVTSIGEQAFGSCNKLKNISIPSGVPDIADKLFFGCSKLEEITIPDKVTYIGEMAFYDCNALREIPIPSGVTTIKESAFGNCSSIKNIAIPSGVTVIEDNVFYGCSSLEQIPIPSGVTSIGKDAFEDCSSIKSITIPSGVTVIEEYVFSGCSALTKIEIPSGVTSIGVCAFSGCSALENITIPKGVTDIGVGAFIECSALKGITIPEGVTSIGEQMFAMCSSLSELTIPKNVTSIGEMAFYGCDGLTEITIPDKVAEIGMGAFYLCANLSKVSMKGSTPPPLGEEAFTECGFVTEGLEGIEVPGQALDAYKEAWTSWAEYIVAAAPTDDVPPAGTIQIGDHSWTGFADMITFERFFKKAEQVTIGASDADSGVDHIYYYISDRMLSETEVKALDGDIWTEGDSCFIQPDRTCVVYAKITDKSGNTAWLSSDGLVFDGTAPVISGVTEGEVYRTAQTVTVTDANLASVKVNGREVVLDSGQFTLEPASGQQTITAADRAGNTVTVTVTVKKEMENGTVDKEAVTDGKAPDTQIATPADKLAQILLTEEEKQQMAEGVDIKIVLDVRDASDSVSSEDKTLVEDALKRTKAQGFTAPQYMDISLFKVIGGSRNAISETKEALLITIKVPDSLKNTDSKRARTFAVIRVHNGVAEMLEDLDDADDTITIASDRFSSYAIVYKESDSGENIKPTPAPDPDDKPTPAPEGKTGTASDKEKRSIEIHSGLKAVQTGKKLQVSWGRVKGADGYHVYAQYCGKDFRVKTLINGKRTTLTIKKVNGKKLNTAKAVKLYVVAYQKRNGKKITLARTLTVHIAGKDSKKYTNVRRIKTKKTAYTLKKGGAVSLRPKAVLQDKHKKQLSVKHTREFRYLSSNKKIAAVTAGGKVKAKGTGNCTIYIFAKNGSKRKIKIKVKK